jgi:hypothetical protein
MCLSAVFLLRDMVLAKMRRFLRGSYASATPPMQLKRQECQKIGNSGQALLCSGI